ncbi:hypothetical protein [Kineococcus rhizosphaerae]|uniref:Flagellar FliJ protein n=1 Tax=Kineococcus rhizosphaerae TaxID=559628 RepID=A0A2T0R4I1_9ACTN|nr:hypothetical protein [Kineococcus rhizosphaerae]PRY15277.1 hypothetical protein CLV37_105205 [Kineococcus rhizosphaerae]
MSAEQPRSDDRLRQRDAVWRRLVESEQHLAEADEAARLAHGSLAEQEIAVWLEEQRQLDEDAAGWFARWRLHRDQRARLRRARAAQARAEDEHDEADAEHKLAVRRRNEAQNELRLFDAP